MSTAININDPGVVDVAPHIREALPDVGNYFLDWIGEPLSESQFDRLAKEVAAARGQNGLVVRRLIDAPQIGRSQTPLTFLSAMTAHGDLAVATIGSIRHRRESRSDLKKLRVILTRITHEQGHAAAVTWATVARQADLPTLDFFAAQMTAGFDQAVNWVRNKDVIRAFENW